MPDLSDFLPLFSRSEAQIRADFDARANAGLTTADPDWRDTRVGSFYWWATQPSVVWSARMVDRMNEVAASGNIATAWESYLDLHAQSYGEDRIAASKAVGQVTFTGAVGTLIGTGVQVSPPQTDPEVEPPTFSTTQSGTIGAALAAPTGVSATVGVGGTLTFSTTYRYVVTALDGEGETIASAEVNGVIAASGTSRQIAVDWGDVAGAVSYNVYRKTGAAGPPYDFLINVVVSVYTDTGAVATNGAVHPPAANTTGGKKTLAVSAVEAGVAGNVAAHQITLLRTGVTGITGVDNAAATSTGTEIESDVALKKRLQTLFQGKGGGTIADYVDWVLNAGTFVPAAAGVGRVTVIPVWNGAGTVQVIIMDAFGDPMPASVVTAQQSYLDPVPGQGKGRAPIEHTVTVQTPASIAINVVGVTTFKPGYSLDGLSGTIALRQPIIDSIKAYIDALEAGDDVIYNHVRAAFFVEGLLDVTGVTVNAGTADIAISTNPAQVAQPGTVTLS